jgi:hypothetical protein
MERNAKDPLRVGQRGVDGTESHCVTLKHGVSGR